MSQSALARKAHIDRATLDALENGRMGELGYTKINNILMLREWQTVLEFSATSSGALPKN